jgi:hypothetical protein
VRDGLVTSRRRWLAVQVDTELLIDAHAVNSRIRFAKSRAFTDINVQNLSLDELPNDWSEQDGQLAQEGGSLIRDRIGSLSVPSINSPAKVHGPFEILPYSSAKSIIFIGMSPLRDCFPKSHLSYQGDADGTPLHPNRGLAIM